VVPPGFAPIPLQNGRPILTTERSSVQQPAASSSKPSLSPNNNEKLSSRAHHQDPEEASDDLLEQLENEIDENDLGDDDDGFDPEDENIKRQLNSIMPNIKKLVPHDPLMDEFEQQAQAFKIPQPQLRPANKPTGSNNPRQSLSPPQQVQPGPKAPSPTSNAQPKQKVQSKELTIIMERQRLFKEAALKAKQEGNVNVALVYLRHAKVRIFQFKFYRIVLIVWDFCDNSTFPIQEFF
jgi:hypothetical protein